MGEATIDKRNLNYDRLAITGGPDRLFLAFAAVSANVGHAVTTERRNVNAFTGHLTELRAEAATSAFAAGGPTTNGELVNAAKDYIRSVSAAVGFAPGAPVEFEGDSRVTTTSEQRRIVSLQQTLNGIEVWGMEAKVEFTPDGAVDRLTGDTVSLGPSLPTEPAVAPEAALRVAAREAAKARMRTDRFGQTSELPALDLTQWTPSIAGQERRAARTTAFDNGPFEDVAAASLVYLYMGGDTRLTWRFVIARDNHAAQFLIFVEADAATADLNAPEILYCRDLTSSVIGCKVFAHNPDEGQFTRVDFPLAADAYPIPVPATGLPEGFPLPWTEVRSGRISTEGNNVRALNGTTREPFDIAAVGAGGDFNEAVDSPAQFITNIFFFCNYMHDFFLLLGFTEEAGNFQTTNVTRKGNGADPVHAFAHPGPVFGTANMATRADGQFAIMNMGKVTSTGRHTANDADVVFHEFVHGVTNRLVGGMRDAQGLVEDQSVSMGEGWGDYFALSIINFSRPTERVVTGNYVIKNAKGIRQRPYDDKYPGTFGDIGKGEGEIAGTGNANLAYEEVHDVGEIWCAALMEVTRKVAAALGDKHQGYRVTWQAVVDGLKLTPKNPSFLIARNAVLRAFAAMKGGRLTDAEHAKVQRAAWEAFARFGMGFDASCPNATFVGCRGGTTLPPEGWED